MKKNNKDILIDYILTLSDTECRDAWFILQNKNIPKQEFLEFGLVKLTQQEYDKLVWVWGKVKTDRCVELLNKWLEGRELSHPIHHYRQLVGWVENVYYLKYPFEKKGRGKRVGAKIRSIWQARNFIKRIPKELWAYDREVRYYVERFGREVLPE